MAKTESEVNLALRAHAIEHNGVFCYSTLTQFQQAHHLSEQQLEAHLLEVAATFATPPISKFYVGAIAWDNQSKHAFLGANLEFSRQALSLVVHAEQAAINNAWLNGAKEISKMTINAAPCGYCRQFMNELSTAKQLQILLPNGATSLPELLPNAFGPSDLGNQHTLFNQAAVEPNQQSLPDGVSDALYQHYQLAYAPYSKNASAVEIRLQDGRCFYGRYAENAAYNPSLSPLQGALSQLALAGFELLDRSQVAAITLLETQGHSNQLAVSKAVLAAFDCQDLLQHSEVAGN
ncbi:MULTISPECIES: cytidine deaminase [unclassified Pseudoalteromonas]|uniref:cytidine deaminase n=1 Tax=unclassified Pseudoalteromonas TaxID=194690 RepID=UPI0030151BCA